MNPLWIAVIGTNLCMICVAIACVCLARAYVLLCRRVDRLENSHLIPTKFVPDLRPGALNRVP